MLLGALNDSERQEGEGHQPCAPLLHLASSILQADTDGYSKISQMNLHCLVQPVCSQLGAILPGTLSGSGAQ